MQKADCTTTWGSRAPACTLSQEAQNTLRVYKVNLPKTALECADEKCGYYKIKDQDKEMLNLWKTNRPMVILIS